MVRLMFERNRYLMRFPRTFGLRMHSFKLRLNSFRLSSKGEAGTLVAIIISLVSFFIVAAVMANFLAGADDTTAENLCHGSISARAATALRLGSVESCFSNFQKKVMPALCKKIYKKKKSDSEEIKKQLADKVARCWWQFGEGRYEEILKNSDVSVMPALFGAGSLKNQCFVCYTMIVDQNTIEAEDTADCKQFGENCPISFSEFVSYMHNTAYKTKYDACDGEECIKCETNAECSDTSTCQKNRCVPTQTMSYLNYVQEYGGPGQVGILTDYIEGDNTYAITFLPKNRPPGSSWAGAIIAGVGVVVGAIPVIACTVATGGLCGGVVAVGLTAVGLTTTSVGAYIQTQEFKKPDPGSPKIKQIFEEREYSSIYISDLTTAQQYCSEGDITGK